MKKIYYFGYYDIEGNKNENRNIVLSAVNKMSYIIEAVEKAGYCVEVISASQTRNRIAYDGKVLHISENSILRLFKTAPWGNKIRRLISVLSMQYRYRKYILKTIKSEDTVIAYHSVSYARFLAKAKKKIGFKLILEAEEIYADISCKGTDRQKEYCVFKAADAFIFPTTLLNKQVNFYNKPYVIAHGTYKVETNRTVRFADDKIHVVYAGTFDPRKGGALAAIQAAEHLDKKYHLHILGFGSENDKSNVFREIERVNRLGKGQITFDGLLSGEDYIRFIQSCDIGLSTQNPTGEYNDTSFPSKILSYMANGLKVVSIDIPTVKTSSIGEYMYYYHTQTSEEIAEAIKNVDVASAYDSRLIISKLDEVFVSDMKELLREHN